METEDYLAGLLVFSIVLLIAYALYLAGQNDAMQTCQLKNSFETCYQIMNR